MTWQSVARGDVRHLRRSRMGQAVAALVLLSTVGVVLAVAVLDVLLGNRQIPLFADVLLGVAGLLSVVLPLVSLVGSYGAIISERKMGSIRFLLGLPNSRLDAYLGKFVSRSLLVVVPLLVGLALSGLLGAVLFRRPSVLAFLGLIVPTVLYAVVFVGFGLTVSAAVNTETRAVVGIIGVVLLFRVFWTLPQMIGLRLTQPAGEAFRQPFPSWYYLLGRLNPINAYVKVTTEAINPGVHNPMITVPQEPTTTPFVTAGFAVFALLCWLAVAPWLGYLRFRDVDLP